MPQCSGDDCRGDAGRPDGQLDSDPILSAEQRFSAGGRESELEMELPFFLALTSTARLEAPAGGWYKCVHKWRRNSLRRNGR